MDAPSWHLDLREMDACFAADFTDVPIHDWLRREVDSGMAPQAAFVAQDKRSNTKSSPILSYIKIYIKLYLTSSKPFSICK